MQLQGLMIMLFFIIVIPIIIMSANHNVFFILIALILFINSIKDAKILISILSISNDAIHNSNNEEQIDDDDIIELEDMTNINIEKFNAGIGFAKSLIIILFFIYCSIYLNNTYAKLLISSLILYWIRETVHLFQKKENNAHSLLQLKMQYVLSLVVDISTIIIIIIVACNKYLNNVI